MSGIDGAACLHLLCATFNPFRDELVSGGPALVDGHVEPNEKPGLGIEVDESLFDRLPGIPGSCYV